MQGFEVHRSKAPIKSFEFTDIGRDKLLVRVAEHDNGDVSGVWIETEEPNVWMDRAQLIEFIALLREVLGFPRSFEPF